MPAEIDLGLLSFKKMLLQIKQMFIEYSIVK